MLEGSCRKKVCEKLFIPKISGVSLALYNSISFILDLRIFTMVLDLSIFSNRTPFKSKYMKPSIVDDMILQATYGYAYPCEVYSVGWNE